MNFTANYDANNNRIVWSGRGNLYGRPRGVSFKGATRNHIISHGMFMRMMVNRINEALAGTPGAFTLQHNLFMLFAAIGLPRANMIGTFGREIRDHILSIAAEAHLGGNMVNLAHSIVFLEEIMLNFSANMLYGDKNVNSQIGDCLDICAGALSQTTLPPGTAVTQNFSLAAAPSTAPITVSYPNANFPYFPYYNKLITLVSQTDWKNYEIQIQGGTLTPAYGGFFVIVTSTDARSLTADKMTAIGPNCHFALPFSNAARTALEWFLFQVTGANVMTAMR